MVSEAAEGKLRIDNRGATEACPYRKLYPLAQSRESGDAPSHGSHDLEGFAFLLDDLETVHGDEHF
jgi:hypothetical protein